LLTPVTVIVNVPLAVAEVVVIFKVAFPEPVTEVGDTDAVAPLGTPDTVKFTALLKPPIDPTAAVNDAVLPALIDAEPGDNEREKSALVDA
jgi:hypothetical protein